MTDTDLYQQVGRLSQAVETLTVAQKLANDKLDTISAALAEQAGERRATRRLSLLTATAVSLVVSTAGLLLNWSKR